MVEIGLVKKNPKLNSFLFPVGLLAWKFQMCQVEDEQYQLKGGI